MTYRHIRPFKAAESRYTDYKASGGYCCLTAWTYSTVTGVYHTRCDTSRNKVMEASVFYGHTRVGYKGKKISVYKFRSMKTNAGDLEKILTPEQLEQYVKEFKIDNDPRITKIGGFAKDQP